MALIRILVVDDSRTVRRIIREELNQIQQHLGEVEVLEAENGKKALELLIGGREKVDMIISDWNMPELDGLTFVRALRENPSTKDVPILMITVNRTKEDVMAAAREGVNGYLIKPFKEDQLLRKVANLLKYRLGS